ncbi:MAG: DUF455 family protein [Anaerolineae bacterium]|nr:DUF455 family protein [Anaerolineae bacterium]
MYLPGKHHRAALMRHDTSVILKRFFFIEQSLIISQAGWLAGIEPIEVKTTLPRLIWQDAKTADDMRTRVFELRYPSRLMEIGEETALMNLVHEARNAPNALALYRSLLEVFKPALRKAYQDYLELADEIGDGPSIRFMRLAVQEKDEQIRLLADMLPPMEAATPQAKGAADAWVQALRQHQSDIGGIGLEPAETESDTTFELPGRVPFALAQIPARDHRFREVRYYWPDVIDPSFPYGDGLRLQLRSAISHLNEVWAVETGGALLHAFADDLEWEFVLDAARWTYDEARHCTMGLERLRQWGFDLSELPLGTYIYDSAYGQDPIYRLGMLYYFETKNIKRKPERIRSFVSYADEVSQHDMDFDWADETIHAAYGHHWLAALLKKRGFDDPDPHLIRARCEALVRATVDRATDAERQEIREIAEHLITRAEQRAADKHK